MASRPKKKSTRKKVTAKTADIVRRVDRLPVFESRTAGEIVGNKSGLPQSGDPKRVSEITFRKPKRIPKAVQDFLRYRHREWEQ